VLVLGALVVGLLNNVLIAALFGLTRNVDAFFAATMLPNLFMFLCIDYLGKNFLPVLALAKLQGEATASEVVSTLVTVTVAVALGTTIVLLASSQALFALMLPGFGEADIALVVSNFWIMAPAMTLMAINTLHEYVCQYDDKFVRVMAIRMALPVVNLVSIVLLGPVIDVYCLPFGYLAGHVVVFVLMAREAKYTYRPRIKVRRNLEGRVLRNAAVVMSTGLVARTKSIVVNVLASSLGGGAISALAFATKLTEPLERAAFSAVKMQMFSRTARLFADGKGRDIGPLYAVGLCMCFLVFAPVLWWVCVNGYALVDAIFARGEFTAQMTKLVAATLVALAPSVLFGGVSQLLANAFYALGRVTVPALVMPLGMILFVAATVPLSRALGTEGIALSTTITSFMVFGILLVRLSKTIEELPLGYVTLQLVVYVVLGGAVMGGATAVLRQLGLSPLMVAAVSLPVGAILYLGVLALVRDRTLATLSTYAWQRIARERQHARPDRQAAP
jgi:putative peptidoglycan lipid II flippase